MWNKIKQSTFLHKLFRWEYWPMQITNIPVLAIWIWFGIKARDLFFFSNTNPVIKNGGVMGASKTKISNLLPPHLVPTSKIIDLTQITIKDIESVLKKYGLNYPIIIKPDIGERGFLVEKINNKHELIEYISSAPKTKFIIQQFIDLDLEISILYHRFPNHKKGNITSLCIKKPLCVTGNGTSTLESLIEEYPRAKFQKERLRAIWHSQFSSIIPKGEDWVLEPIGNHSRGATFLNGNNLIDDKLVEVFDAISHSSKDLYYGRFDIKCDSLDSIKENKNFYILEYNGVASEPAHVYQPGYSIWNAYKDYYFHWNIIYNIHKAQKKRGVKTITLQEAWSDVRQYFSYKKWASSHL